MINTRYKRLTGPHAGKAYVVIGPFSEIETPLRWVLHNEDDAADKPIVAESALNDPAQWQSLE
jgi:hypothetical protein